MNDSLYLDQQELEIESIDMGISRYFDSMGRRINSAKTPEMKIISEGMRTLVPAIIREQEKVLNKETARGIRKYGRPLVAVPADKLAALTLVTLINNANRVPMLTVALYLASRVRDQKHYEQIKQQYRKEYDKLSYKVKNWNLRAIQLARKEVGIKEDWDHATRVHLGSLLVHLALTCTDFFEQQVAYDSGKTTNVLSLKKEYRQYLETQHTNISIMYPYYRPMIVPPTPWTSMNEGGYLFHQMPLIKDTYGNNTTQQDFSAMQPMLDGINRIQATGFRICMSQLRLAQTAWKLGGGMAGLPPADEKPIPPMPEDFEYNEESAKAWKREAAITYADNARLVGQRESALSQLWLADFYKSYSSIWFVWQADWRGRAYPVGTYLHPQADDFGRNLLEFADGKPLGSSGVEYLAVHLANSIGLGKLPRSERVRLVREDYAERVREWVSDPFNNTGWQSTDKPWSTLRAATEWVACQASGDPDGYVSHLPIAIDGRCNGLQHFSAIGRDSIGGRATNVLPDDRPQDLYEQVSREVNRLILADMADPSVSDKVRELAIACSGGHVTRTTVKRAVMTTPYGVTAAGMTKQFVQDGHVKQIEGSDYQLADYLKDKTYEAVGRVVVSARAHMDWLQNAAAVATDMGKPVIWTTRCGLRVKQEYLRQDTKRILTVLQKVNVKVPGKDRKIRRGKQLNSVSPNFIHSVDGDHLYLTVNDMPEGTSFLPVHDSYSTHGADMAQLAESTRLMFIQLHESEPLSHFKKDLEDQLGVELPPLPDKGDMDLRLVLDSLYFFD